ncbi:MAG TPA: hypothetical protein VLC74_13220 [Rhizomicrobium sp.]|nr:hypothetical protein [Rhizomicrobium sp.]
MRNHVLAAGLGRERVYSRMFVKDFKPWPELTADDLKGYRAYTDLTNYCELPLARPCLPVALLRDPVHRAVSLYGFVQRKRTHNLNALAMNSSLEEFYRIGSSMNPRYFRNVQATRICGRADARMALEFILSKYLAVGFTSEIDAFAGAMSRLFGWSNVRVERKPFAPDRYDGKITRKFREMVLSDSEEDLALFMAMSAGPPYAIPRQAPPREVIRRAKRLRDSALTLARRVQRRIGGASRQ